MPLPSPVFLALPAFLLVAGCAAGLPRARIADPAAGARPPPERFEEQRARFVELRADVRTERLLRNRTPGPSTSLLPQTLEHEGVSATVQPVSAEAQAWNRWSDDTARLFNDSSGYLWSIAVSSERPARWSPDHTRLAVNDTEQVFPPAEEADEILQHLVHGALLERAFGLDPELSPRMEAADGFRSAYLGQSPVAGTQEGVLMFPAPAAHLHAVAMELTLGIEVSGRGVQEFRFLFE